MRFRCSAPFGRRRFYAAGMSILELLAVIAIIGGMVVLGATSMEGIFRGTGRRAAVEQVIGMLEQGRARALTSGRVVYVAFADHSFSGETQWRAMALYEETADAAAPLVAVTPWVTLSGRMAFASGLATPSVTEQPTDVDARFFKVQGETRSLPYLKFNPMGGVDYPQNTGAAKLYIGWSGGEADTRRNLETIQVALYTGRAVFHAGRGVPDATTVGIAGTGGALP